MGPKGSREIAKAALMLAFTDSREEEEQLKLAFLSEGIKTCAVDCGGEFISSVKKIIERAVVAAKREGVIRETHAEEGSIAGATHEALSQIMPKATGLNVGGKIGIARQGDHISVAIFFGVGLVHLNDVAVGIAHRALP